MKIHKQRKSNENIKVRVHIELEYGLEDGQRVRDVLAENADEVIGAVIRAANYADYECIDPRSDW